MKLGKLLLGAGVVTSALAVSAGFGVQSASAEDAGATAATAIDIAKIAINYSNQNIVVKEAASDTADTKLYVGIGTYSAKTPTDVKVKKWIEYDNDTTNGVTIDTSSLAVTKTQYVVIKGDKNTKEVAIQLAATPSKLAASIDYTDPAAPALSLKDITKGKSSATPVKNVEFSVANGSKYTTYTAKTDSAAGTDLTKYQKLGATLKVRQAASTDIDALDKNDSTGNCKEVAIKLNGEVAKAYAATGTFASKELKVKVAKLASGPKITVNYTKNTVSIPKTAQYRTAVSEDFANTLVANASKNTVLVPLSEFNQTKAFTLDVRTAAKPNTKDATKSKSASNITEVVVPQIATCESKVAGDTAAAIDKTNFASAELEKVTANEKVTFKYTGAGKATATLTNADTENAYDVYVTTDSKVGFVGDANAYVAPASTVSGAKKLAAGKTLKLTKLKDGDKIFIRVAGNAKKKTFASEYGAFGTVKLPVATAAPTATATGK
ncbi:MAG: hypothetical protein BHW08_00715 [Clostridium sp. CAG:12237_41]|nr:MAG: hypothetical protein BHW08_00715 [Clostridium sp. CAG:12237_41]